jgi:DNA replication protein DnaC
MNEKQKIETEMEYLKLSWIKENYHDMTREAAKKQMSHMKFLSAIIEGEVNAKKERAALRRIQQARFPVVKTLEQFQWDLHCS